MSLVESFMTIEPLITNIISRNLQRQVNLNLIAFLSRFISSAKDSNINFVLQAVCQGCVLLVLNFWGWSPLNIENDEQTMRRILWSSKHWSLARKGPCSFLESIFGTRCESIHSTWALCYFLSVSGWCSYGTRGIWKHRQQEQRLGPLVETDVFTCAMSIYCTVPVRFVGAISRNSFHCDPTEFHFQVAVQFLIEFSLFHGHRIRLSKGNSIIKFYKVPYFQDYRCLDV